MKIKKIVVSLLLLSLQSFSFGMEVKNVCICPSTQHVLAKQCRILYNQKYGTSLPEDHSTENLPHHVVATIKLIAQEIILENDKGLLLVPKVNPKTNMLTISLSECPDFKSAVAIVTAHDQNCRKWSFCGLCSDSSLKSK